MSRFTSRTDDLAYGRELGSVDRLHAPKNRSASVPRMTFGVVCPPRGTSSSSVVRMAGGTIREGHGPAVFVTLKLGTLPFAQAMLWLSFQMELVALCREGNTSFLKVPCFK